MIPEMNKALVRRYIEQVLNGGELDLIDELFASPLNEQVRKVATIYRSAFPDMHETIHDLVAEGDTVMARWTFRGTQLGQWHDIPPTGKTIEMLGFSIYWVRDGQIVDDQALLDLDGGLEQLGATVILPGVPSADRGE